MQSRMSDRLQFPTGRGGSRVQIAAVRRLLPVLRRKRTKVEQDLPSTQPQDTLVDQRTTYGLNQMNVGIFTPLSYAMHKKTNAGGKEHNQGRRSE